MSMNKDKQRIIIAEACGWERCGSVDLWKLRGTQQYAGIENRQDYSQIPHYTEDLNSCVEMEKVLTLKQRHDFRSILGDNAPAVKASYSEAICHATAAQRCEAFLKCRNLWTEDKT